MRKIAVSISILIVLALVVLTTNVSAFSGITAPVAVQEPTQNAIQLDNCYSLDVVFLVDQSGSMSGEDDNPNDPLGNRFQAPRYAMDWLANNRLGHCPNAVHRIGVISFGEESKINLDLTVINPSSQADWDSMKPELEKEITEENMGTTDPLKAFKDAQKMINNAPDMGTLLRKKAIILLTDGQPCVLSLGCDYGNDKMNHPEYMNEMVNYVNTKFAFAPSLLARENATSAAIRKYGSVDKIPDAERNKILIDFPVSEEDLSSSIYLWVVAMNADSPYLETDAGYWKQMTDSHAGGLVDLKENAIEVPKQFNEILSSMEGITPTLLGCGNLEVDPYLSGAVLDIFKMGEGLEVEISSDGKMIKGKQVGTDANPSYEVSGDTSYFGVEQYSQFGAIEHYRFVQPPAGSWKIDASDCQGIEAAFITFKPIISYSSPSANVPFYNSNAMTYDPSDPYYIKVKITDSNNQVVLKPDSNYPLTMKAIITAPDQSTTTELPITYVDNGDWIANDPIPVDQLGDFTIHLTAVSSCTTESSDQSNCVNGQLVVVDDTTGIYSVRSTDIVKMKILSPSPEKAIPLHAPLIPDKLAVLPVEVVVQLVDRSDSGMAWQGILNSDAATAIQAELTANGETQAITLSPDPEDPTLFKGYITTPAVLGSQQLTVKMVGEYKKDKYQLEQNPVTIVIQRQDPLLNNVWFYFGLAGLLGLTLIVLIIKRIWDTTNIVNGSLEFVNESSTRTVPLNKRRRVTTVTVGLPREVALKKIVARNDGDLGGKRRIALEIYPAVGKPTTLNLIDGSAPQGVSSGTWRVQYKWGGVVMGRNKPKSAYPYHR